MMLLFHRVAILRLRQLHLLLSSSIAIIHGLTKQVISATGATISAWLNWHRMLLTLSLKTHSHGIFSVMHTTIKEMQLKRKDVVYNLFVLNRAICLMRLWDLFIWITTNTPMLTIVFLRRLNSIPTLPAINFCVQKRYV